MIGARTYVPIQSEAVDADLRWRAAAAARVATRRLGLPPVEIVWMVVAPPGVKGIPTPDHSARGGNLAGMSRMDSPRRIWVRADLPDAPMTVAHECRHLWQYLGKHFDGFRDEQSREADAEAWADWLMTQPLTREELYPWLSR